MAYSKQARFQVYGLVVLIWIIYSVLILLAPPGGANRYGLSATGLALLRTTFLVPYLFIWLASIYAVLHFKRYQSLIIDAPEREGFRRITFGLFILALVTIIPSFISLVSVYWPDLPNAQKYTVIVRNYLTVFLYLLSFWYLRQSSRDLCAQVEPDPNIRRRGRIWVMFLSGILAIAYLVALFHNPFRSHSNDPLVQSTYFLPDLLIVLTVAIPYIFAWFLGSLAVVNTRVYAKSVSGSIYRKAFYSVSNGLLAIVTLSIIMQFLSQAALAFRDARLGFILIIIYVLIIAIAFGYLLIAKGARRLAAIEEV